MSVVLRGVKNAFRNKLRTLAAVLILALGIGLSLSMMVANEAVTAKINDLKTQVGTHLTIHPAGSMGGEGGGEPLKMADVQTVRNVAHVADVAVTSAFSLENENAAQSANFRIKRPGSSGEPGKTSLVPAIEPGTLGKRGRIEPGAQLPQNFMLPIMGTGSQGTDTAGAPYNIVQGRNLTRDDTADVALLGTDLAAKNNLNVNGTFTAYGRTFTVVGIYDQGTRFENGGVAFPLAVAQSLSGTPDEVGSIVATVDSIDNLDTTRQAVVTALGADKADVVSGERNIQAAIDSLKSVQYVSVVALIGALVASVVITFLIMVMVVRERRREIGVLKAIGGSNSIVVGQFVAEAMVLVMLGAVVGLGLAIVSSGSIAEALVNSNAPSQSDTPEGVGGRLMVMGGAESATSLVGQVAAQVGWTTIAYACLAALLVAVAGSAIPAWLIAKVRPAEVLRGE